MGSPLDQVETALITGASTGIGAVFARNLAARGKNLILVARSEDKLQALAEELAARHGVRTWAIAADLCLPNSASALVAETERLGLVVDLLINNAGFSKAGEFSQIPFDVQADMVRLNVNSVMELCHLYLPAMCRRGRGGIINVASNAAFQPVPYMAVYAASKAFVLSFSEAVAEEVACKGVAVMALCPGATDTNFWTVAGAWENHRRIMVRPERVVATALRAFERRRSSVIDGLLNKALAFSIRLAPRRLVARLAVYAFRNRNKTVDQGYDISFKPSIKR